LHLPASEQTGAMAVDAVQLVLTDKETAASDAIEADHYPLSPRVQTRRAILNKIRPEPPREPRAASLAMSPARSLRVTNLQDEPNMRRRGVVCRRWRRHPRPRSGSTAPPMSAEPQRQTENPHAPKFVR